MNIVLIGTGNVAVTLARLFIFAGHSIKEIAGRDASRHRIFQFTGGEFKTNYANLSTGADVYVIAVSDSAIAEVAAQLPLVSSLVVHTSGATPKEILKRFKNYGVLYPLQSLRKEMETIPLVPFFVDANTEDNKKKLSALASSTGNTVSFADDKQRLHYHLAAVLCSNFSNHLYALTETFCQQENIDFKNLLPLIHETASRLRYFPPAQMQTGPAIRHDEITIEKHLELLKLFPRLQHLYEVMTESIQAFEKQVSDNNSGLQNQN